MRLKLCPFCGGEPVARCAESDPEDGLGFPAPDFAWVACTKCGARSGSARGYLEERGGSSCGPDVATPEMTSEAAGLWNKRIA